MIRRSENSESVSLFIEYLDLPDSVRLADGAPRLVGQVAVRAARSEIGIGLSVSDAAFTVTDGD